MQTHTQPPADRWWQDCPDHGHQLLPSGSCHECAMLQPEPAETKSDPEIEATATVALEAFWRVVQNRHPGNDFLVIEEDVLIRLEAAAYDAIEAWRAEQAETSPA